MGSVTTAQRQTRRLESGPNGIRSIGLQARKPKCESCPLSNKCSGQETQNPSLRRKRTGRKSNTLMPLSWLILRDCLFLQGGTITADLEGYGGHQWECRYRGKGENRRDITPIVSRELRVSVWRGTCSEGIDPKSVPISNLDSKILAMVLGP